MAEDHNKTYTIAAGAIRSLASSFPVFSSIGQAWSEYENYRTTKRINELFENLKNIIEVLKKRTSNIEEKIAQIQGEIPTLIEITIEQVKKEFSEEKRYLYAQIFAALLTEGGKRSYDEKTFLLYEFETLTCTDLKTLKLFKNRNEISVKNLKIDSLQLSGNQNEQLEKLACLIAKLESRGLILKTLIHGGVVYVPDGLTAAMAKWSRSEYQLLPLGKELLSLIE